MPITRCGFNDTPAARGHELLTTNGPTLLVHIGFDPTYDPQNPATPPALPSNPIHALVDTGAVESCIDVSLAVALILPIVDRRTVSGVHGPNEVNMHLAHILVPALAMTIYGSFAGVALQAGGQLHQALIGRSFLRSFTMVYEGRTGTVTLSND